MAPQTRRMSFPNVVIERDTDSEESSSSEEDIGEDEESEEASESESELEGRGEELENNKLKGNYEDAKEEIVAKSKKAPITISLKKVCKVSYSGLCAFHFFIFFFC